MNVYQTNNFRMSMPAVVCLALVGLIVSLALADDGATSSAIPRKSGGTATRKTLTLAEALTASQKKSKAVEYFKKNGERGVLQQQVFKLDRGEGKTDLQIALVVDGTNSMGRDLGSLKFGLTEFVSTIRKKRPPLKTIEVAVVVYRDLGSASGPVTIITSVDEAKHGIFLSVSDPDLIKAIDRIETEDGTPRFPEQVDRGLHVAITQLNWDKSKTTARSIILAGDAPPFNEGEVHTEADGFNDLLRKYAKNGVIQLRTHSLSQLADAAKAQGISIFSILCDTGFANGGGPQSARIAELARPGLAMFAQSLADETGGRVLNLTDPRLVEELQNPTVPETLSQLPPIESKDIEARKNSAALRIAVLPSVPMDVLRKGTDDWPATAGYTYACALVNRLCDVDSRGVVTMSPQLWEKFSLVNLRNEDKVVPDSQILKDLASKDNLDLDFVLWGNYSETPGKHELTLRAFDRNGVEVAQTSVLAKNTLRMLVEPSMLELSQKLAAAQVADPVELNRFVALSQRLAAPSELKREESWHENLLEGYRLVEESTAYEFGNAKSVQLNERAIAKLTAYLEASPNDPLAYLLRSSCRRNLGDPVQANADLGLAFMFRAKADEALKLEIEADSLLFGAGDNQATDPFGAVHVYEQLVALTKMQNRVYSKQALRAKWMLSGLYLGGFDFYKTQQFQAQEKEYLGKSRELILDILVYWPESYEAEFHERYVEPHPERKPRQENQERQLSFRFPAGIALPKHGGKQFASSMKNYNK